MGKSRFPNFYELSIEDRVKAVFDRGLISEEDYIALKNQQQRLDLSSADKMIENVIGVMGLPVGLGLNFLINNKDYVVPLAVEEPSIVAALSSAAKIARTKNGFGRIYVSSPMVTCLSCIASRRADCTFAGARLISSAKMKLAKMGPFLIENSSDF